MRQMNMILMSTLITLVILLVGCQPQNPLSSSTGNTESMIFSKIQGNWRVPNNQEETPRYCWATVMSMSGDTVFTSNYMKKGEVIKIQIPESGGVIEVKDGVGDNFRCIGYDTIQDPIDYNSPYFTEPYEVGAKLQYLPF